MLSRILALAYGYLVCLAALVFFAYGLVTFAPSRYDRGADLVPVEVSVINPDTTATGMTGTMTTTDIPDPALQAFDRAMEPKNLEASHRALDDARTSLEASKHSFDQARVKLETERRRTLDVGLRLRIVQRVIILLFSTLVFVFHWRWLRGIQPAAA